MAPHLPTPGELLLALAVIAVVFGFPAALLTTLFGRLKSVWAHLMKGR